MPSIILLYRVWFVLCMNPRNRKLVLLPYILQSTLRRSCRRAPDCNTDTVWAHRPGSVFSSETDWILKDLPQTMRTWSWYFCRRTAQPTFVCSRFLKAPGCHYNNASHNESKLINLLRKKRNRAQWQRRKGPSLTQPQLRAGQSPTTPASPSSAEFILID